MTRLVLMALAAINARMPAAQRGDIRLEWIVLAARVMWPIAPRLSDAVVHASAPWLHLAATTVA